MIRTAKFILLCTVLASGLEVRNAASAVYVGIERIPGVTPVVVRVGDKPRTYFRITSVTPLVVPIEGPVRVRVVSRVECAPTEVASYRLVATEDDRIIDKLETESSASPDARLKRGAQALGKSRHLTFNLPAGRHRVSLALSGSSSALVRIQTSARRWAETMVSLTPIDAAGSVNLSEGEKLIPYYTIAAGQPVRIRVIGPSVLELSSRLDFDATMRGMRAYRLRLTEQGRTLRVMTFRTTKAVSASYENVRNRIPSKVGVARIPVAGGTHELAVELLTPARGTARVHVRIPAPSIGSLE